VGDQCFAYAQHDIFLLRLVMEFDRRATNASLVLSMTNPVEKWNAGCDKAII
jgi:hypothetical protein